MNIMPENISTYGGDIDNLGLMITIIIVFWFILTLVTMFYFMSRFSRKKSAKASYVSGETWKESKWVEIPHILVILCDIVVVVATIVVWNKITLTLPPADVKVAITGRMWNWIFTYPGPDGKLNTSDDVVVDEKETGALHVPVNKNIVFELKSKDVVHSFWVREIRLKQDAVPGRTITRWFNATKIGKYDLGCAEICGPFHAYMRNFIIVESQAKYDKYIRALYAKNRVRKKVSLSKSVKKSEKKI